MPLGDEFDARGLWRPAAAGFDVCFLPEFSPTIAGVRTQPVTDPEVVRQVSLVSRAGRRFSPAVLAFTRAIRAHD